MNIMVERDFYSLSKITAIDIAFMEDWLQTNDPYLVPHHRRVYQSLAFIADVNDRLQRDPKLTSQEKAVLRGVVTETEENLHASIERAALPLLNELRERRVDFLNHDDENAIKFFIFLAHQYFRTKGIRSSIGKALSVAHPQFDFSRLKNVLCYCFATNLGASLFLDREKYDPIVLVNSTDLGFIAGDQPVVNVLSLGCESAPKEMALYYPVTPNTALLWSTREYELRLRVVTRDLVRDLNDWIAWNSTQFLIAHSTGDFRGITNKRMPRVVPRR